MYSRIRNILRVTGIILFTTALCIVPSLIVALLYHEYVSAKAFSCTLGFCLVGGLLLMKFFPTTGIRPKKREGYLIVSLTWILISLISAVPLWVSRAIPSYVDAFFEMCSGYSTTGSTILVNIEALPNSMLFWRSFTHWIGGMGIIVFTTALMPGMGIGGQVIASAETPGPTMDKLTAHYSDTAKNLYTLYLAFTGVQTLLYVLGGMKLLDALILTFGTVGTGGFANYNDGMGHFTGNPYLIWVTTVFMFLCGTNFNLYFAAAKRGPTELFRDEEFRLYGLITLVCTGGILTDLLAKGITASPFKGLTDAAFHVVSIMTTTGYATTDYDQWPTFAKMLLLIVFLTGASSSSTGGGPKVIRIVVALKLIRNGIGRMIHPNRVSVIKVNGRPLSRDVTTNISNFLFFYILVLFGGMLLISLNGFDIVTTFSSVLTCMGNIGPGFAKVGPVCNFSIFTPFSKIVLSLLMIAGRLELFTFFMLFSPHYWNTNRY